VTKPEEIARAIARGAATMPPDKPLATVFMSSKGAPPVLASGPRGKIPSFSFPENAALALSAAVRYGRFRDRAPGKTASIPRERERRIRKILDQAREASGASERPWLEPDAVSAILELTEIRTATSTTTAPTSEAAAEAARALGCPVVLKAVAPGLLHKSDVGGVALGLWSRESVLDEATKMKDRVEAAGYSLSGFFVQREVLAGIEGMVGVTTDPGLGPIVVAGLGGRQVELFRDAAFRLPPASDLDAYEMVDSLKMKKLLDGFRGAPPGDRDAFAAIVCRISALVDIAPEISELDLNPVKILPPGQGAVVLDARIRIGH
jgi:acyl-CoA synthetase (NDP forming)